MRRFISTAVLISLSHLSSASGQTATGPDPGSTIPAFSALDQHGQEQSLETLRGPNGLLLLFHRSADW